MTNIPRGRRRKQKSAMHQKLASFVSPFKIALQTKEFWAGLVLAVLVVTMIILTIREVTGRSGDSGAGGVAPVGVEEPKFRHPYTGAALDNPFAAMPAVFAVMVENSYEAWPLSGVEKAFMVIEAPAEGDIPRFEAFFSSDEDVAKIGPVRSARPYYVEWAAPWVALYAHVGGSPEALDLIKTIGLQDGNEFFNGQYFWRSTDRSAPHNAYTSTDKLQALATEKVFTESLTTSPFIFQSLNSAGAEGTVKEVKVDWGSGATYDPTWKFENGHYVRYQGSNLAQSSTHEKYIADNVIVMATDIRAVDDKGRKRMRTIGSGAAMIYQNGNKIEGTWNREDGKMLIFRDSLGQVIKYLPGKIWVEVVADIDKVTEVNN